MKNLFPIFDYHQIQGDRDYQEDFFAIVSNDTVYLEEQNQEIERNYFPNNHILYLLTDGMGGMGHGDVASKLVTESFLQGFLSLNADKIPLNESFNKAITTSNDSIVSHVNKHPKTDGMGTTLVAVLWDENENTISWASVGDSPLWLFREGELIHLNEIHNVENALKKYKQENNKKGIASLSDESPEVLTSAIDGSSLKLIDIKESFLIQSEDILILASDGMETLEEKEICRILNSLLERVKQTSSLEEAKEYLEKGKDLLMNQVKSKEKPHQDNATFLISFYLEKSKYTGDEIE